MKWEKHPTNPGYIQCTDYPNLPCLVRLKWLPKGYLWQAGKFYGYESSIEFATCEAEEVLLMQVMSGS